MFLHSELRKRKMKNGKKGEDIYAKNNPILVV